MGLADKVAAAKADVQEATEAALRNPSADSIGAAVDAAVRAQAVDLSESPVEAGGDVPVHVAWSRVMGDVQWIGKGRSPGLNYQFRGIDAVRNAVGPVLRRHGVMVLPISAEPEFSMVTMKSGAVMHFCRIAVTYAVIGPKGDRLPVDPVAVGEAFDSGDKAATKAQSIAERTMYITALAIPTDEPAMDTEHGPQHEIAGVPPEEPPTAEEYYAEIMRNSTSVERLLTIRREITKNHPEIGATVVTELDGEQIKLADALAREGRKKQAKQ